MKKIEQGGKETGRTRRDPDILNASPPPFLL
jgi:hypothetical protein